MKFKDIFYVLKQLLVVGLLVIATTIMIVVANSDFSFEQEVRHLLIVILSLLFAIYLDR